MNGRLASRVRRLSPHRAGIWLGLLAPLTLCVLGLKTARIAGRGLEGGLLSLPELYLSDVCGLLAIGLVGHVLLDPEADDRLNHLGLALIQTIGLTVGALEVVGHRFYTTTGATIDYPLLTRTLGNVSTNLPIVLTELSIPYIVFLVAAAAALLTLPWVVCLLRPDPPEEGATETPLDRRLVTYLVALALAALSLAPPILEPNTWFARSTTANVAISLGYEVGERLAPPRKADAPAADLAVTRRADAGERPTHVALIVLESVRASATGLYNPNLETTPFLSELADRSTVARRAYATIPHTTKALVSILCGIEPHFSLWVTEARPGGIPARCLPEVLGEHGYRSAFFQTAHPYYESRPRLVENVGFDDFFSGLDIDRQAYHRVNYFGWEEDAMLPNSRRWLERRVANGTPTVATYLTLSGHHPYETPPDFDPGDLADDDPPPLAEAWRKYLGTVRYTDRYVRKLVDQYKELGLYEETLFVIVSDHGEAFGEHGARFHDDVPYDEGLRIVTMLHDPTRPDAPDVDRTVSQLDLLPTILDRLAFDVTAGDLRGHSLDAIPAERPVRSQCFYERRCLVRIADETKYIYRFGRRPPEVYDLADDPMERHNLADRSADRLDDWTDELLDWRRYVNAMHAR